MTRPRKSSKHWVAVPLRACHWKSLLVNEPVPASLGLPTSSRGVVSCAKQVHHVQPEYSAVITDVLPPLAATVHWKSAVDAKAVHVPGRGNTFRVWRLEHLAVHAVIAD